jgi:hypothetical protein
MARRRSKDDLSGPLIQLFALLALGVVFTPLRQIVLPAALGLLLLVVLALAGFVIYRLATRPKHGQEVSFRALVPAAPQPVASLSSFQPHSFRPPAKPIAPSGQPGGPALFLDQVRAIDWFQFEKVIALTYRKLGYTVTRRGGANPDGGIDLMVTKDGQTSAIQCKHWGTRKVREKAIREFLGALTHAQIKKGIFITLCGYTVEAAKLAAEHQIQTLSEAHLAQMLEETGASFDSEVAAILRDKTKFCPKCERKMVLKTARRTGEQFWGCPSFPNCDGTLPARRPCSASP